MMPAVPVHLRPFVVSQDYASYTPIDHAVWRYVMRQNLAFLEGKAASQEGVTLMTLHSAKGLEFKSVYLVGMEEGLLPHRRALDEAEATIPEERRLCYVGITRARDHLTLTRAASRKKWGKPRPSLPSRFLFEMTGRPMTRTADDAGTAANSGGPHG